MRIQPDRLEETFATQVDDDSPSYGERQMRRIVQNTPVPVKL